MSSAPTDARTRTSRFAGPTTGTALLIVLVLAGAVALHHPSSSGGTPRADATATSQLMEAESVVMSEGQLAATPTPAAVHGALNASSQLRGHVLYAATTLGLQRTNTVYVDSASRQTVILWDRSPSGHVWNVSIVANPPGMRGRLVLNGPSSPGIEQGPGTSMTLSRPTP